MWRGPPDAAREFTVSDQTTVSDTEVRHPARTLGGFVVGATAILLLMLSAFVLPLLNSGPHHVPLGVVGLEPVVTAIDTALDDQEWDVRTFPSEDALTAAILDREVMGGLTPAVGGLGVHVATAAGPSTAGAITALGNGLAARQEVPAQVTDVVPFPADDPRGAGFAATALPLILAGILPAVGMLRLFPGHRHLRTRLIGALIFSLVAGACVAAFLQLGTGTLAGNYWANAASLALGMAALSFTFLGLESLLGFAGLGIGVAIVMLLGNPLSGLASGPFWLPDGWSTLGQALPPGATGSLLRSTAYFSGDGAAIPALTLTAYVAFGLILAIVADRRRPRTAVAA